jgi:hypothetical protein
MASLFGRAERPERDPHQSIQNSAEIAPFWPGTTRAIGRR